jgi:hypothetical protein
MKGQSPSEVAVHLQTDRRRIGVVKSQLPAASNAHYNYQNGLASQTWKTSQGETTITSNLNDN